MSRPGSLLRRSRSEAAAGSRTGFARGDARTKRLTPRLRPGEIAVIDHTDLDRVSAEALIRAKVSGVLNAAPSISGRYPNLGPQLLLEAGIPLIDAIGPDLLTRVPDGARVELEEADIVIDGTVVASGCRQTEDSVSELMAAARDGLAHQIEAFAANTMSYLRQEQALLIDGVGVPEVSTPIQGRHVLVVVRGYSHEEDLASLRPYIRETRPVLLGVDGGADALLAAGYVPDLIVGDMDSVSDAALSCGAELVVHAYPDGRAPGRARVDALGLASVTFPAAATSEDVALLLADESGATVIVAVGTHANLEEFLDKGRDGMSSTFLTRLRVGSKLVDAKGVSRLYRSRIPTRWLVLLILATLLTLAVSIALSEAGRVYLALLGDKWDDFTFWLRSLGR